MLGVNDQCILSKMIKGNNLNCVLIRPWHQKLENKTYFIGPILWRHEDPRLLVHGVGHRPVGAGAGGVVHQRGGDDATVVGASHQRGRVWDLIDPGLKKKECNIYGELKIWKIYGYISYCLDIESLLVDVENMENMDTYLIV